MEHLQELLAPLSAPHQQALRWFAERANQIVSWPEPLSDDLYLATQAKGIYKPSWSNYALSVRQTLGSKYPDREPVIRPDGTWKYEYFQEGEALLRDRYFTNRGLMECIRGKVPIGVMRQVDSRSPVRYKVLGLALPTRWHVGYFQLEGFSVQGFTHKDVAAEFPTTWDSAREVLSAEFDITRIQDARRRALASIVTRRGQATFRKKLLDAYNRRCAVTEADAEPALEAAHIIPYLGAQTNHVSNGLLLRGDIHTLFDLGAITVDTTTMSLMISPALSATTYSTLAGKPLRLPRQVKDVPNLAALDMHREYAEMVWSQVVRVAPQATTLRALR